MSGYGFLAIWCDMDPADLGDYRAWLTQEHIQDRILSPGFLGVRLFCDIDDPCSHFILYATQSPAVFSAAPYRAILDAPSDWTRRIMPRFGPFDRATGAQLVKLGNGFGAFVAVARVALDGDGPDAEGWRAELGHLMALPDVVAARAFAVDRTVTARDSGEKTMRHGEEGAFDVLLVVETLSGDGARNVSHALAASIARAAPDATHHDVSTRRMIYGETPFEAQTHR